MPRIRTIKPEILDDEKTASLDSLAWRVFVSLIVLADDYGNGRADPRYLSGQILWGIEGTANDIRESLARLSRESRSDSRDPLVRLYKVHGQTYYSITKWASHQKVDHPGKPRVPGPDDPDSDIRDHAISNTYKESSRGSRETLANPRETVGNIRETLAPDPDPDPDLGTNTCRFASQNDGSISAVGLTVSDIETDPSPDASDGRQNDFRGRPIPTVGPDPKNASEPKSDLDPTEASSLHTVDKSTRKDGRNVAAETDTIVRVMSHYRTYHPRALRRPTSRSKEWRLIKARLAEGFTVEDMCEAIDGCHRSPFHCGDNEQRTKYLSLKLILRDADNVNRFIELAKPAGKAPAKESPWGTTDEQFADPYFGPRTKTNDRATS